MPRVNPRNNATMQRVQAPAPVIVKTPPPKKATPVKTKRPTRSQPTHRPTPATNPPQNRNVTQPVKKQTGWCSCEFWDVGCKAGCFSQEQIVDPVVSGTQWLAGGADVHVTQPLTDAVASTQEAIDVFGQNTQDAINSTVDAVTDSVKFIQESVGGTADWAGQQLEGVSNLSGGLGSMMGNMMRGMGNIANVGSSSFGWIKWVLIAIGALIAGFIAWRVLK